MTSVSHLVADPWVLSVPLAFSALSIFQLVAAWRKRRLLARVALPLSLLHLMPPRPRLRWLVGLVLTAAIMTLAIGASSPRWGQDAPPEIVAGRDLVVVLDMSGSMRATDAPPTRFDRARAGLDDLFTHLGHHGGHRVALVAFAAEATVVCPLTHDYRHLQEALASLDMDHAPRGLRPEGSRAASGTRMSAAMELAATLHDPSRRGYQDVLLLSDGDDPANDDDWLRGLAILQAADIPISTIGFGDPNRESKIPVAGRGEVSTRLHERPLQELARRSGGTYLATRTEAPRVVEFFTQRIDSKEAAAFEENLPAIPTSRHTWFYLAALVLWGLVLVFRG